MYSISKRFDFCASHQLEGLPETHQCARLHGHNYQVFVTLAADELDEIGFIVDYGELDRLKVWLDTTVEHQHLNAVFNFNPTAENLAKYFYEVFKRWYPQVFMVKVKETEKTEAVYMDTPSEEALTMQFSEALKQFEQIIGDLKQNG